MTPWIASALSFDPVEGLVIFVLATFIGFEVILRVPTLLHTPLMSGSNAISGIIIVGAIAVAGLSESTVAVVLSLLGVALATVNVVGGFVVTDRMLLMFQPKRRAAAPAAPPVPPVPPTPGASGGAA